MNFIHNCVLSGLLCLSAYAYSMESSTDLNKQKKKKGFNIPSNNGDGKWYAPGYIPSTIISQGSGVRVFIVNKSRDTVYCQTVLKRDIKRCADIVSGEEAFYDLFKCNDGTYEIVYLSFDPAFAKLCDIIDFQFKRGFAVELKPDDVGVATVICQDQPSSNKGTRFKWNSNLIQSEPETKNRANSTDSCEASNV